jgi:hypothetical protein
MMKALIFSILLMLSGAFLLLSTGCTAGVSGAYGVSHSHYWGPYHTYPHRAEYYRYADRRYHTMGRPYDRRPVSGYHRPRPYARPRYR